MTFLATIFEFAPSNLDNSSWENTQMIWSDLAFRGHTVKGSGFTDSIYMYVSNILHAIIYRHEINITRNFTENHRIFLNLPHDNCWIVNHKPIKHVRWFVVLCFDVDIGVLMQFTHPCKFFRVASQTLGQSYDCPSVCVANLKDMGKATRGSF